VQFLSREFSANAARLEIESDSDSILVLAQTFHRNWRATINNVDAPVLRANHAFQAIALPAGRSVVRLEYGDEKFSLGLRVSAFAFAGWLVAWFSPRLKRRDDAM
jgi:uncharacterized membrane protein YfhO